MYELRFFLNKIFTKIFPHKKTKIQNAQFFILYAEKPEEKFDNFQNEHFAGYIIHHMMLGDLKDNAW